MFERIGKDTAVTLFYLFIAMVLGWTAMQTFAAVHAVMPESIIAPYVALGLFDVGALAWLFAFLKHAQSSQRTIAFWMTFVDLTGIMLMVGGSLQLFSARTIALTLLSATIGNVFAVYIYHMNSPANRTAIAIQSFKDMTFDESLKQAERITRANIHEHGAVMALGLLAQFKYDLGLPMSEAEKKALTDDVIDANAIDLSPVVRDAPKVLPGWMIAILKALGKYKPANITNPTAAAQENAADSTDGQNPDSN